MSTVKLRSTPTSSTIPPTTDGWVILLEPHELQINPEDKQLLENLMEHDEYVEYLAEL